ncbi:MAG TPA: hypothetical protein VMV97_05325 [Sulfuriferula sp.]|nr:hypothetical protein [Sulfuriferula sp.]
MLILLVIALGILAATVFVGMLSSSGIQSARDKETAAALAEARAALIGYAASDPNRPGELPCPDYDGDGKITLTGDYTGSNCKSYTGRLPWKSLGLPDLRDGYGEQLWYAVSDTFHANSTALLNSDVPGQLSIAGTSPANNVIAIVFAPGPALAGQLRDAAHANDPANYLEGNNALGGNNTDFTTANASSIFNDRLLPITNDSLFQVVEKRVARELVTALQAYALSNSGNYPYAAPLDGSSPYCLAGNTSGRMPLTDSTCPLNTPTWFSVNAWNNFVYYALAPGAPMLTVGATTNVQALIIMAGRRLNKTICAGSPYGPQGARPSANICDYLDDTENTNGDNTYTNTLITPTYNDQTFIVAP